MKLYRDMNEQERRIADQHLAFSMEMQKLAAEDRMASWDSLPKEEREKFIKAGN